MSLVHAINNADRKVGRRLANLPLYVGEPEENEEPRYPTAEEAYPGDLPKMRRYNDFLRFGDHQEEFRGVNIEHAISATQASQPAQEEVRTPEGMEEDVEVDLADV